MEPPSGEGTVFCAPAKVNLNLRVTGRRDDGYHLLESTVIFTAFGDRLTVRPATGGDSFELTGPFAPLLEDEADNICLRAVRGYRAAGGAVEPLAMRLEKNIPVGAGLGGGSSDAAAMLRCLEQRAARRLGPVALADLAAGLGADVPVCLAGIASHMTGIGDILHPVTPPPRGHIVLAWPGVMLSTPEVFRAFAESGAGFAVGACDLAAMTAQRIAETGNDLAGAAQRLCPEITSVIDTLRTCSGILAAQMTGSGSACFGLFAEAPQAAAAAARVTTTGHWAVATSF